MSDKLIVNGKETTGRAFLDSDVGIFFLNACGEHLGERASRIYASRDFTIKLVVESIDGKVELDVEPVIKDWQDMIDRKAKAIADQILSGDFVAQSLEAFRQVVEDKAREIASWAYRPKSEVPYSENWDDGS